MTGVAITGTTAGAASAATGDWGAGSGTPTPGRAGLGATGMGVGRGRCASADGAVSTIGFDYRCGRLLNGFLCGEFDHGLGGRLDNSRRFEGGFRCVDCGFDWSSPATSDFGGGRWLGFNYRLRSFRRSSACTPTARCGHWRRLCLLGSDAFFAFPARANARHLVVREER